MTPRRVLRSLGVALQAVRFRRGKQDSAREEDIWSSVGWQSTRLWALVMQFLSGTSRDYGTGRVRTWVRYLDPDSSMLEATKYRYLVDPSYRGKGPSTSLWSGGCSRKGWLTLPWCVRHHSSRGRRGAWWTTYQKPPMSDQNLVVISEKTQPLFSFWSEWRKPIFPSTPIPTVPPSAHWGWILAPDCGSALMKPPQHSPSHQIRVSMKVGDGGNLGPRPLLRRGVSGV